MKVLFTADWHIKLGQKNVPKAWQINRYKMLFEKILEKEQMVDLVVIGGDIFDKMPSLEELELFFEYVAQPKAVQHLIYDGNHEATKRGHTFLTKLKGVCKNINHDVKIVDDYVSTPDFDILPYCRLKHFEKKGWYGEKSKLLFTHVRGEIPPHVKPEIDLSLLDGWETVLAGDLHARENSQRNIIYPGSPVSTSFHRSPVNNGVIIFDTETLKSKFIPLELPQLIRKTVDSEEEAVPTDYDHTIYEITGNIMELAGVDTTAAHIDKKLIQKNSEKTLNLENKTIAEELVEYLTRIQKLDKESVVDILQVYHDYIEDEG